MGRARVPCRRARSESPCPVTLARTAPLRRTGRRGRPVTLARSAPLERRAPLARLALRERQAAGRNGRTVWTRQLATGSGWTGVARCG